jgi:hypothetical protein
MMLKSSPPRNRPVLLVVSILVVIGLQFATVRFMFASSTRVEHRQGTSAPVIVSVPIKEATVGQEYSYQVVTEGRPAPTFQLSAAPVGMTIGANSGTIYWIPEAAGSFDVVVLATNSTGTTSQSFQVRVTKATNLSLCPADMIAYWQQEEIGGSKVFSDIYGGHHATCEGENCPVVASGQVGEAQYFDGNSSVSVIDKQVFDWGHTASFGLELWVNTQQLCNGNAVFLGRYRGGSASWWLGCGKDGHAHFFLRDSDDKAYSIISESAINNGAWHHIVAGRSFEDAKNYLYVDSQLEASIPTTYTGSFANSDELRIGYYANNYFFVGMLDEIAIYDRMLKSSEVLQHYQDGLTGLGYCSSLSEVVAPQITSSPVMHSVVDQAYRYDVDATGNPAPTYQLVTSPLGMTINSVTGVIQWVSTSIGTFDVTVEARNVGGDVSQSFSISVTGTAVAPEITSSPVVTGVVGQEYRYNVTATGNPEPTIQLIGAQPEGMLVSAATKSIRWIPGKAGTYPITVQATNSAGSVDQSFTISVTEPLRMPMITSTPVTVATIKQPYNYEVEASGYPTPTFQLEDEPSGMTIDADTGLITWMPETTGNYSVKVQAINSVGSISQDFVLQVRSSLWLPNINRD